MTGTGLDGSEMLDVAVTLVGHVRSLAQQTAGSPPGTEAAMDDAIAGLVHGREDRFPALAAAIGDARTGGKQDRPGGYCLAQAPARTKDMFRRRRGFRQFPAAFRLDQHGHAPLSDQQDC